jgi:lipopolysaccharide transport system ATP-binding protein
MKPILEIENISKKFLINHEKLPYLSLRDKLSGMFSKRGKERNEEFWALKDVSFRVEAGEAVGVIGKNGAGKSTLLKILSRITPPTKGRIISRGRIASLLEVGTGFHQELSGRENIFMNGSILGMRKREILQRFDEIVDFSGIEKFLDTPLKHYSSGMQLRLAFAVAAHLDPEILIIDEVLAVGDSEFQKKCIKKMEDVAGQGRTLLFVSHNLSSLKAICKSGYLLQRGQIIKAGGMEEVVDHYMESNRAEMQIAQTIHYYQEHLQVHRVTINDSQANTIAITGDQMVIRLDVEFFKKIPFELDVHIKKDDVIIASYANFVSNEVPIFDNGRVQMEYNIALPEMRSGHYQLDLFFTDPFNSWFAASENNITLEIINSRHHIFLATPTLKWGSVLMNGNMKML